MFGHIGPEYHSGTKYEIQSCRRFGIIHDNGHLVMIDGNLSNIVSSGEQYGCMTFGRFAFSVIVGITHVASDTFAFKWAFFVDTILRTTSRYRAFVNIWNIMTKITYTAEFSWLQERRKQSWGSYLRKSDCQLVRNPVYNRICTIMVNRRIFANSCHY